MRRAAARWMLALVAGAIVGCSPRVDDRAAASPAPAATAAEADEATATPDAPSSAVTGSPSVAPSAPVAVDLPDEFPRAFPLPPGSIVTQATAERDEGSVQASAVALSRDGVQPLFGWYESALGGAGWNIDHEEPKGNSRSLHAVKGDSAVDVVVAPDDEHAGWTAASLNIYWSQGKGR